MDLQKTQLFTWTHWIASSYSRGTSRFLPCLRHAARTIHLAAKSQIMAGAFSPNKVNCAIALKRRGNENMVELS
jgi:hypothetical protein